MRQLFVLMLMAVAAPCIRAQIVITEFMASCRDTIRDQDGYSSDWVELHNPTNLPQSTHGWSLGNGNGRRWHLPDTELDPQAYLIVFLSGKDRQDPRHPLHANFRLGRSGGRLQLFAHEELHVDLPFDRQHTDISQGFAQASTKVTLVPTDAVARVLVPGRAAIGEWKQPLFDDQSWRQGAGGFGFDKRADAPLASHITTDLGAEMRGFSTSACYRFSFEGGAGMLAPSAFLRVQCAGGFIAWLNGHELARHNLPDDLLPDSKALLPRDGVQRVDTYTCTIDDWQQRLRSGRNVLCIRSFSHSQNALEHLLVAELSAWLPGQAQLDNMLFLAQATPGWPNGEGRAKVAPTPELTVSQGLGHGLGRFTVRTPPANAVIRFTLDGSEPHAKSPRLDGTFEVSETTELRARTFCEGDLPSPSTTALYTRLAPELNNFPSDLPVIVVSTRNSIETKDWSDAHVHIVAHSSDMPGSLRNPPDYSGHGAIRLRGSSTLNLPKRSYGIELRKEDGSDRNADVLGLPPGSDWVLYAPHNYDQSHLRNALCYELAHRIGLDAPQYRFCELFVSSGPTVTAGDYQGLYLLVEKIEVGKHRVDLEKLSWKQHSEPGITGGYIVKIDRPGPGETGFVAGGQRMQFVYPKERHITDPQRAWLQSWFDQFGSVLAADTFADPQRGYAAWIDVDNFIDYHMFHEYSKNPDAYTLSTYMHKHRGGRLRMGPVWDFDRAMRTNEEQYWVGRPTRPTGWTADNYAGWWGILFRDSAFRLRYRQRGRDHLENQLAVERVHTLIDELAATIAVAEERDRVRWPIIKPGDWHNEIANLKQWITDRSEWFTSELLETPTFHSNTGDFRPPFTLSMGNGNDDGTLYYSLNGADPMLRDGRPAPSAQPYSGPLVIDSNTLVRARTLVDGHWSRPMVASYVDRIPTLAIAEVMYNPPGGRDHEWLEFVNFGDEPIDLAGIVVDGPIRYHFSTGSIKTLQPGQRVLIVRDRTDFGDRYDTAGLRIAGEFLGRLSNTEGEITVTGTYGEDIARLRYQDAWHPSTDGQGRSLEASSTERQLTRKEAWRPSAKDGGSPGR